MSSKRVPCPCSHCRGNLVSNHIRKQHTAKYFSKVTEQTVVPAKQDTKTQVNQTQCFLHSVFDQHFDTRPPDRDHHPDSCFNQQLLVSCKNIDSYSSNEKGCNQTTIADNLDSSLSSEGFGDVSVTTETCEVSYS